MRLIDIQQICSRIMALASLSSRNTFGGSIVLVMDWIHWYTISVFCRNPVEGLSGLLYTVMIRFKIIILRKERKPHQS